MQAANTEASPACQLETGLYPEHHSDQFFLRDRSNPTRAAEKLECTGWRRREAFSVTRQPRAIRAGRRTRVNGGCTTGPRPHLRGWTSAMAASSGNDAAQFPLEWFIAFASRSAVSPNNQLKKNEKDKK